MAVHVVVDGSNLATEGRTMPSLAQLNDAVAAYREERPDALVTVVVDATFGHRIAPDEVKAFDKAVASNELVAPPAGAIGRGDAFVLSIANKVQAVVVSNDSYQEFHGTHPWLFDEGRLIGGKPVPHVGWVFVARSPVRGPLSRKAVSEAKRGKKSSSSSDTVRVGSAEASKPMPVPKSPPPGRAASAPAPAPAAASSPAAAASPARRTVNDLLQFLTFVERHPIGTSVTAVVDHYSSHGAYVRIGDVVGYVPLRLMASPTPRSARELMAIGETVTLVVQSFVAAKRSVDLAVPAMAAEVASPAATQRRGTSRSASSPASSAVPDGVPADADVGAAPSARRSRRSATSVASPVEASVAVADLDAEAASKPRRAKRAAPPSEPATAADLSTAEGVATRPVAKRATAPRRVASASAEGPVPTDQSPPAPAGRRRVTKAAPAVASTIKPPRRATKKQLT